MGSSSDVIVNEENVTSVKQTPEFFKLLTQVHSLNTHWTFWVWKSDVDLPAWSDSLYEQITITTLEEFWALQHRIVAPSLLKSGNFYQNIF